MGKVNNVIVLRRLIKALTILFEIVIITEGFFECLSMPKYHNVRKHIFNKNCFANPHNMSF